MSRTISAGIGKPYGLERVCRVLGFPRSTIYAARARESSNVVPLVAQRRGPKPRMPDADLLNAIRADLAASPFIGEGHRKVWARLAYPARHPRLAHPCAAADAGERFAVAASSASG